MPSKPLVSFLMAVYNEQKYIKESLDSIMSQSYSEWELVLVDDGSTDNTLSIVRSVIPQTKLTVIQNKQNMGLTQSLNIGVANCKGKYIARLDADDICLSQRVSLQVSFLESYPNYYLCGSKFKILINELGEEIRVETLPESYTEIKNMLPRKNTFAHSAIMFRNNHQYTYRAKFAKSQDYDLYLNLLSSGEKMYNLPEALVKIRFTSNSISNKHRNQQKYFASQAQTFYHQRLIQGKDDYENFNPALVLGTIKERDTLESDIWYFKHTENYSKMRHSIRLYLNQYKKLPLKYIALYMLSFEPLSKFLSKV